MTKQVYVYESSLCHYGIKGQKWGERRFQNPDGSLTPEGIRRYNQYKEKYGEKTANRLMRSQNKGMTERQAFEKEYKSRSNYNKRKVLINTAAGVTGGAAGAAAGYIGGKKLNDALTERKSNIRVSSTTIPAWQYLTEGAYKYYEGKERQDILDHLRNSNITGQVTKNKYYYDKIYKNNEKILGAVGGVVAGGLSTFGANKIQDVASGYSKFDTSKEGLKKFYEDMKNARDD